MFSWSKKKETKRRPRPENSEENEFGIKLDKGPSDKQLEAELRALAGVDSFAEENLNLNEGEEDEESELLRLIGGNSKGKRPAKKAPTSDVSLGDISADIEVDEGDEDVEVDENDEELLGELLELTQPEDAGEDEPESESESETESQPQSGGESDTLSILKERLKMYKTAEAKAKESNESSRARRFSRGIKTIENLLKKAKAGQPVSPNDIPPVIALNLKPAPPVTVKPEDLPAEGDVNGTENELVENREESEDTPSQSIQASNESADSGDVLSTLTERLKLYQIAEVKAKESGETTRARRFNRGIKTLEGLIREAKAGKPVSPSDIPPAVALNLKPAPPPQTSEEQTYDNGDETAEQEIDSIDLSEYPSKDPVENEPEPERNIIDVLSERLQVYKAAEAKAKETGETTRVRRFGRGIKTLQDLIRQATAGKPIAPDDIPPPIALNLKPVVPLVVRNEEEEEPRESAVESDNLVRSSDNSPVKAPLKFMAVDDEDIDLDDELIEEVLEVPRTVMEGLEQRVRIYTKLKGKAEAEGNEALVEENTRILRLYHNAIKTFKNGGYVDVLRLPCPKGCPPIPIPFHLP